MQISRPVRDGFEQIFLSGNIRVVDAIALSPAGTNLNCSGACVLLDVRSIASLTINTGPLNVLQGQSFTVGHPLVGNDGLVYAIGVLATDVVIGKDVPDALPSGGQSDYHTNFWAVVQIYGHCPRIMVLKSATSTASTYLFLSTSSDIGLCSGFTRADIDSLNTVSGATVVRTNKPLPSLPFMGYKYEGAVSNLEENSSINAAYQTSIGKVSGFLLCMGASPRG